MIDVLPIVAAGILTAGAAYATARYYPLVEERLERAGVHPRAFVTRLTSTSEEKDDDEAIEFEAEELSETAAACLATLNAQVKVCVIRTYINYLTYVQPSDSTLDSF
eukprot:m.107129 g.107129  ORF g.107129 m.107129 type:complete len:107 (-) comp15305_c0_seq9:13-333(-)